MRKIQRSRKFKRDYKKTSLTGQHHRLLRDTIEKLAKGEQLDDRLKDHPLSNNWRGYRELHIKPDLLLIYKLTKDELRLARLNTHTNIFKK